MSTPFLSDYLKAVEATADVPANPVSDPGTSPEMIAFCYDAEAGTLSFWDPVNEVRLEVTLGGGSSYGDSDAQDAVGSILSDAGDIDFTYTANTSITAAVKPSAITNAQLANAAAWSLKLRNAGTSGAVSDAALADLTEEAAPAAGDFLVGFLASGEIRKFDIDNLPSGSGGSGLYPAFVPLVNADFSWFNQAGATVTDNGDGTVHLRAPGATGVNIRVREKAIHTAPYRIEAAVLPNLTNIAFMACGLILRDHVGGKIVTLDCLRSNVFGDTRIIADKFNSETAHSGSSYGFFSIYCDGLVYLAVEDDGANRILQWSFNGRNWETLVSHTNTDFVTPTRIGIFSDAESTAAPASGTWYHWERVI